MKLLTDPKELLKSNFNRTARLYDTYCHVQNLAAARLLEGVPENKYLKILDIGCGTGNYTVLLGSQYPQAHITAVDLAESMISCARAKCRSNNIRYVIEDIESFDAVDDFDLITSNVSLQWIGDIEGLFFRLKNLLCRKGAIAFSFFGPKSLNKLEYALRELFGSGARISASGFSNKRDLERLLSKYFDFFTLKEERLQIAHGSVMELLQSIRYTGTRGFPRGISAQWTRGKIRELEDIYKRKGYCHSKEDARHILTTYQLFLCYGKAK